MKTIEKKSIFEPNKYENDAWDNNKLLCGVDEVGRGSLAGPLVTVAAILKPYASHKLLKDSKLLNESELLEAYEWLCQNSIYSISYINHRIIDKINIYQATLKAMKRAVIQLSYMADLKLELVLVDAMPLKIQNYDIISFNYGEKLSSSIAAASIIAKVTRDRLMARLNSQFEVYHLSKHKGYGTAAHENALNEHGKSIIHRISFIKEQENHHEYQTTIC